MYPGLYKEKFCVGALCIGVFVPLRKTASIYRGETVQNSVPLYGVAFLYIWEGFCASYTGFLPCHIGRILHTLCTM